MIHFSASCKTRKHANRTEMKLCSSHCQSFHLRKLDSQKSWCLQVRSVLSFVRSRARQVAFCLNQEFWYAYCGLRSRTLHVDVLSCFLLFPFFFGFLFCLPPSLLFLARGANNFDTQERETSRSLRTGAYMVNRSSGYEGDVGKSSKMSMR